MSKLPFRYEDWMEKTSAGAFAVRSASLKALDEAIRKYDRAASMQSATVSMKDDIRKALSAYLAEEEGRYGVEAWQRGARNKDRIIEQLVIAVTGAASVSLDLVQNFAEWPVPTVAEPQIDIAPPPPAPPIVDAALEKKAEKWSVTPAEVQVAAHSMSPSQISNDAGLLRDIDALYTDLVALKGEVNSKLQQAVFHFTECVKKGFNDFKELHRLDAADIAFNISLVVGAFDALTNLPFPFSAIGTVGKTIAGLATTDTQWSSITVDMPTPAGFKGKIEAKVAKFTEFRNQNVSPKRLESQEQLVFRFIDFFTQLKGNVDEAFASEIQSIDRREKRLALSNKRLSTVGAQTVDAKSEIDNLGRSIENQFKPLTTLAPFDSEQIANWITVQLIADYAITGLCNGKDVKVMKVSELGKVSFGDKFARFLASPQVGLLRLKEKSGDSKQIYGAGQIPWDGSPNHIIGVMLYLDWFRRTLNPFELLRQQVRPAHFRHWSEQYIRNLGSAMATHKATAFEDVYGIHKAVTAAENSTVLTGGDISDAFANGV